MIIEQSVIHVYTVWLIKQIWPLFFEQKFSTYCQHIGKVSAKIFKQTNHSQRSYKNLVACPIIRPQLSKAQESKAVR